MSKVCLRCTTDQWPAPVETAQDAAASPLIRLLGCANILWHLEPAVGKRQESPVTTFGTGALSAAELCKTHVVEFHVWAASEWVHGVRVDAGFALAHWCVCPPDSGAPTADGTVLACQATRQAALVRADLARYGLAAARFDGNLQLIEYRSAGRLLTWRIVRGTGSVAAPAIRTNASRRSPQPTAKVPTS